MIMSSYKGMLNCPLIVSFKCPLVAEFFVAHVLATDITAPDSASLL